LAPLELLARTGKGLRVAIAFGSGLLTVIGDSLAVRAPFTLLRFRALTTRNGVPLTLFGNRHLGADLLHLLSLHRDETRELGALRFGPRPLAMCLVAGTLGVR
jgi:hypothetical protein